MSNFIPIRSELKSRRIKFLERPNPAAWAYEKELREQNKTRKVYPVDPYVEVYQFRDGVYNLFTENADGGADVWMHLILGPERALLIDTSFGIGNLKGLCDQLTGGMELLVANTHPSYDHSFGNCQFDKCYFQEYAWPKNQAQFRPQMWDYLFDEKGNNIWLDFDRADIIPFKEYEVCYVPNGHVFDLGGGHEVELIWLPGHHAGHCGYLDRKNRILFSGDVICSSGITVGRGWGQDKVYGSYCTVEALAREMAKVVARKDEFDTVFPSHYMLDLDPCCLDATLAALQAVMDEPGRYDFSDELLLGSGVPYHIRHRLIKGFSGDVGYTDEGVYES